MHPALIAILNITPNSFSDTGQHFSPDAALVHAHALIQAGANILDLGAEASSFFRTGVAPVDPDEQLRRLLPVLDALPRNITISIDTRSAKVAQECLDRGATIINDISAGTHDPDMLPLIAKTNASIILMHISPTFPDNPPQSDPDILATVRTCLGDRIAAARLAGIPQDHVLIDPGLGFGKTPHDNWTLALQAQQLQHDLHLPLVLGCSRKRFLETTPPAHLVPPEKWQ